MTLKITRDELGTQWCLTICNVCGSDSYAKEEDLKADGWRWDDYPDGPHQCPGCVKEDELLAYIADEMWQEREYMEDMGR